MDNGASSYRRYLNGDPEAFDLIVKEYFDPLVLFLNRYTHSPEASEEIALDVFAWVDVHKGRYDFSVSLKTFLYMLGRSRALSWLRKKRPPTVPLSEVADLPSPEPTPEEALLRQERHRALHQALASLPEPQQTALHLVYFEALTPEEAAVVLKKTRKQVYNLLYRGKLALRTFLGKDGIL